LAGQQLKTNDMNVQISRQAPQTANVIHSGAKGSFEVLI